MLIDRDQGGAGAGSRILNLHEQTSAPAGLSSVFSSTEALGSASGLVPSPRLGTINRVALRAVDADARRTWSAAMSRRKSRNPSDYEVGYGRPPRETRFRPGQSGNPTGSRKGSKTIGARLRELMNSKVTVTEQGRSRRISRLDVMLRQLANDAMRGDQRAIRLIMDFLHRYGAEAEGAVRSEEITSEDLEILSDYLRKTGSSKSDSNDSPHEQDDDNGEGL
jgi:hypothetical protein